VKTNQRTRISRYWNKDSVLAARFEKVLFEMMTHARLFTSIRMNITEVETETREARFVKWWRQYPAHTVAATHFTTHSFCKRKRRKILYNKHVPLPKKDSEEFCLFVKPNDGEIEAEFIHEFMQSLQRFFLHANYWFRMLMYCNIENNQQCKSGDLILIDAGAEYANYSSDMTRTIPVSGKYNDRQKPFTMPFYVKNEATKMLVPGTL
jgi:Xaa-Pro aminopeptidase